MFARVLSILFVLLLFVGVPVLSFSTGRDGQRLRQLPRLSLYFSATISEWILGGLGLLVFLLSPLRAFSIGFRPLALSTTFAWAGAMVALCVAATGLGIYLERHGWWPPESELVRLLIPRTRQEKLWSVLLLVPTAALCEEFLYRGFLLAQLTAWLGSSVWAWAASTLAFGLAHVYQGWHGMLRASVLGALLAYPVIHFGSLYPSMLAHGLIDAVALLWLGPKFLPCEPVNVNSGTWPQ